MPVAEVRQSGLAARTRIPRRADWELPYAPLVRQGDLQTILAHYWPRRLGPRDSAHTERLFDTEPGTKVLARVHTLPRSHSRRQRPTVLAVHGLTACDRAPYMLTTVAAALRRGFDCVRLNVRNCGGTEHLCRTLYHSGLTSDLGAVVSALSPSPLFILGFSMGGNIALKLAGEWASRPPPHVRGICAISPPIRLDTCSRNIGRRRNAVYQRRFLRQLRATMRRKRAAMPDLFPPGPLPRPGSIWEFDDSITAPAFGFSDAADYYRNCSAAAYLDEVRTPALVIQSQDDPFIPFEGFDVPALRSNPWLRLASPPHGGHVAFLASGRDRFWAHTQAMRFFASLADPDRGARPAMPGAPRYTSEPGSRALSSEREVLRP